MKLTFINNRKIRKSFALALSFLLPLWGVAQNNLGNYLPISHAKYQQCQKVLNAMIRSADLSQLNTPLDFQLIKKEIEYGSVAGTRYLRHIKLHEKAYDVCMQQGADSLAALALLLGHELYHYYHEDGGYACNYLGYDSLALLAETKADLQGTYYAKLAGYSPCGVVKPFINALYAAFSLRDDMTNYPLKNRRVALSIEVCDSAEKLVKLFELGNMLMVIQEYDKAAGVYDYLCTQFGSREMYFNAAVARLVWVKESGFSTEDKVYDFPILFESNSRVEREDVFISKKVRLQILNEIDSLLSKCLLLDEHYTFAQIYKVFLCELYGVHTKERKAFADKMKKGLLAINNYPQQEELLSLLQIGIGISDAELGEIESAKKNFKQMERRYPALYQKNIAIMNNKEADNYINPSPIPTNKRADSQETVGTITPFDDLIGEKDSINISFSSYLPPLSVYLTPKSELTLSICSYHHKQIRILSTCPNYVGTSALKCKIGDNVDKVLAAYGKPIAIIYGTQYTYYQYSPQIVFITHDNIIQNWFLYLKNIQ